MKSKLTILLNFYFPLLCSIVFFQACEHGSVNDEPDKENKTVYVAGEQSGTPAPNQEERGRYIVNIGGCNDCHTPKIFSKEGMQLDTGRLLSGHPENAELPPFDPKKVGPGNWVLFSPLLTASVGPWGATFAANLTPDSTTGLGKYTEENFLQAIKTGKHMGAEDGRPILPPMPWTEIRKMTDEDLKAMYAYLRTLKPVKNIVPPPIPPNELSKIAKGGKVEAITAKNNKEVSK